MLVSQKKILLLFFFIFTNINIIILKYGGILFLSCIALILMLIFLSVFGAGKVKLIIKIYFYIYVDIKNYCLWILHNTLWNLFNL